MKPVDLLRSRYVLSAAALGVGLVIAELAVALVLPRATYNRVLASAPRMFRESPVLPYGLRPNFSGRHRTEEFDVSIEINSLGHRSGEFQQEKGKRFRVLAIGDSFTFGYGVEAWDAYPARLQKLLRHRSGDDEIEVVNAGFAAAYSPDTYFLYLKEYGVALKPDLVLVGFFVGNDITSVTFNEWTETDDSGLPSQIRSRSARVDERGYWVPMKQPLPYSLPLLRNSHLFHLARAVWSRLVRQVVPPRASPSIYDRDYGPEMLGHVEHTQRMFLAMAETARRHDIPVVFAMIPTLEQVGFSSTGAFDSRSVAQPQQVFGEFFARNGIEYLDLLDPMRHASQRHDVYYPKDQHWNQHGHSAAASALAEYLYAKGLE